MPGRIHPMPRPDERCPRCGAADPVPIVYGMPDAATGQLRYADRDISFYTNDLTREVLVKAYKEAPPDSRATLETGMP